MKLTEQVENILRVSKKARNSDKELLIIYMQKSGMNLSDAQIDKFKDMPSMESITRARRILQEQGKYEATEEVDEARFEKYQEAKNTKAVSWLND